MVLVVSVTTDFTMTIFVVRDGKCNMGVLFAISIRRLVGINNITAFNFGMLNLGNPTLTLQLIHAAFS